MSTELTILSFGAGQDSTALLHLYRHDAEFRQKYCPGRFAVVFSDTGDEHPRTYTHLLNIRRLCLDEDIEFFWLDPAMGYHTPSWQSLRHFMETKTGIMSKAYPKSCTDNLKIGPIYKWLDDWLGTVYGYESGLKRAIRSFYQDYGKINVLIGIAAGEERRVAGNTKNMPAYMRDCINRAYPLVELGLDRKGCQDLIRGYGEEVPPPSNCKLCPFMSLQELLWLYRTYPDDYHYWVARERAKLDKYAHLGDKNLGVWGKMSLPEALDLATEKYGHMTDAELDDYKMSHGHCVMSKY